VNILVESTKQLTVLDGVPVRVWKGLTGRGTPCFVFVHRIAVQKSEDQGEFERELTETLAPGQGVPLSQVL